jgi:D-alanyl-D-alanine-carboxypeptidase/D-alanyl-D-alanine-endopeptidase
MVAAHPPAFVLGAIRGGETAVAGYGNIAANRKDEPTGDTLFRIGSITKAFTGQTLANLAADGSVKLTDPLTKYLPNFATPLSPDPPIRLIDLATHSAGLPREVPREEGPPDNPFVHVTREAYASWVKANPLLFPPGTAVSYSNFGFDVLAMALSAAAGKPYPELLAERVLRPLGLTQTTFTPDLAARPAMQGHGFDGAPLPFIPTGDVIVGAGGLYSSAGDLLRWLGWHLDRLGGAADRVIDHAAYLWRDGLTSVVGMDESGHMDAMGLGWVIMAPEGARPLILQKAGGLQGVFSYVAFAPTRNVAVVAAINAFDVNAGLAMAKMANDLIAELAPR